MILCNLVLNMQAFRIVVSILHTEHYICASYKVFISTGSVGRTQS